LSLSVLIVVVAIAVGAGFFGSLLGLGGGLFVVPLLTTLLGTPTHEAIGASIVAVIASSSAGGATYLRRRVVNVRLGMTLELATVAGAILGALTGTALAPRALNAVFGLVLAYTGVTMWRGRRKEDAVYIPTSKPTDRDFSYYDPQQGADVRYRVRNMPAGLSVGLVAGYVSGLLGIGGGLFKVPAMTLLMGIPLRVATATSTFMIGVTATASAYIQYAHGFINPVLTAPVVVGVVVGALGGPRLAQRLPVATLRRIFVVVLIVFAVDMLGKAALGVG